MTDDSAFKKQVRTRMAETGENYTTARRMVIAGRDPGPEPVALRVFLNPHVDLELTYEMARAYAATDEQGQRNMATRLLAEHIEMAGVDGAGVAGYPVTMTRPGVARLAESKRPGGCGDDQRDQARLRLQRGQP